MSQNFPSTPTSAPLIEQWLKAKEAELGWQAIRRDLEARICAEYGNFAGLKARLESSEALTAAATIGEALTVTVGYDLVVDQVLVSELLQRHPQLLRLLFKPEYKVDSRATCRMLRAGEPSELALEISQAVTFKEKRPSFTKAK